jgi:WD40 repeat protein
MSEPRPQKPLKDVLAGPALLVLLACALSAGLLVALRAPLPGGPSGGPRGGPVAIPISTPTHGRGPTATVHDLAFSPDGETVAGALNDGVVRLWNRRTGELRGQLDTGNLDGLRCVVFSPDGRTLAAGSQFGRVHLLDVSASRDAVSFKPSDGLIERLAFTPDGGTLVAVGLEPRPGWQASETLTAVHWDVTERRLLSSVRIAIKSPTVALSADGRLLATAIGEYLGDVQHPDKYLVEVKVWDTATGKERALLPGYKKPVYQLALAPDGRTLVTTSAYDGTHLWDLTTLSERRPSWGESQGVCHLVFSPDGQFVAGGLVYGGVELWDVATRKELADIKVHPTASIPLVAISPDGRTLATANASIDTRDSEVPVEVRLWDISRYLDK